MSEKRPSASSDLDLLRNALRREYERETARPERDVWSQGFTWGLRHALELIEKLTVEKGSS